MKKYLKIILDKENSCENNITTAIDSDNIIININSNENEVFGLNLSDDETLKMLDGYIDVYLPDLKYAYDELSKDLSDVNNYFEIAKNAIK